MEGRSEEWATTRGTEEGRKEPFIRSSFMPFIHLTCRSVSSLYYLFTLNGSTWGLRINPRSVHLIPVPFPYRRACRSLSLSLRPVGSLLAARRTEREWWWWTEGNSRENDHPDHLSLTTLSHLIHPLSLRSFPCHSLSSENEENEMRRA